ncbi:MAG: hypothetical protein LC753_16295 [Acidobacteria bacterium]|nr:hypothetical protein [Acidobacteriota bacterium]MCA1651755.1 hypothetical protein [Acidobacteriota bacterium]
MEFRDYAAKETSALLGRLLASRSDASLEQIRSVREALDAAARVVEKAAASTPQVEKEVRELVERLNSAAAAALQRVKQQAKIEVDAARADLTAQRAEKEKLAASLADTQAQINALRASLQKETDRALAAEADLDSTIDAHKLVDAARLDAEAKCLRETSAREEAEQELQEIRELLAAARAEVTQLGEQREAEAALNAALNADLTRMREEHARLEAALVTAEATARTEAHAKAAAQSELLTSRAEREAIAADLGASNARVQLLERYQAADQESRRELEARLDDALLSETLLREDLSSANADRETMAAELGATRTRLELLERDQDAHDAELRQLQSRLDDALLSETRLREDLTAADADLTRTRSDISTAGEGVERLVSLVNAAVDAADELATSSTVAALLAELVKQLSSEFKRVALFRVKANHLEGEHQAGFEATADATKLVLPLNVDSLITRAATSGVVVHLTGSELDDVSRAPFGGTPVTAIALPIAYQGETFAVVYADSDQTQDGSAAALEASAGFAKLLVRHAAVLLTRLSQELKTLIELREYAAMLLQEAEQMYAADVQADKSDEVRRTRLKDTIDCARQLFGQRAELEGAAATSLLEEEIAKTIEAHDGTEFGRDLTSVSGHEASSREARRTAS